MRFNIEVESGDSVRLPTGGKYCDRDIVVTATSGNTDAAYQQGVTDGKQAERDRFQSAYMGSGKNTSAFGAYLFAGRGWCDETYFQQEKLVLKSGQSTFTYSAITDTKVEIELQEKATCTNMFNTCPNLVTVRKVTVNANVTMLNAFRNSPEIMNVEFEGVLACDMDFSTNHKLTRASIINIFNVLSTTASGKILELSKTAINKAFETSEGANNGLTSDEWIALTATKPNWTITLV